MTLMFAPVPGQAIVNHCVGKTAITLSARATAATGVVPVGSAVKYMAEEVLLCAIRKYFPDPVKVIVSAALVLTVIVFALEDV